MLSRRRARRSSFRGRPRCGPRSSSAFLAVRACRAGTRTRHLALLRLDEGDQREHRPIDDAGDARRWSRETGRVSAFDLESARPSAPVALMGRQSGQFKGAAARPRPARRLTQSGAFHVHTPGHEPKIDGRDESGARDARATGTPRCSRGSAQRSIVFVGLMGAGKTAIGRKVAADARHCPSSTATRRSRAASRMTVPELFELYGEAEFRALEQRVIAARAGRRPAGAVDRRRRLHERADARGDRRRTACRSG